LIKSIDLEPGSYAIKSPDTLSLEALAILLMRLLNRNIDIVKKNTAIDFIETIEAFPKNIFPDNPNYNLNDSLAKRIQEIKLGNGTY